MTRARKEGAEMTSAYQRRDAADLERIAEEFKTRFPEDWEALRLCPLQHGLESMIEKLKH